MEKKIVHIKYITKEILRGLDNLLPSNIINCPGDISCIFFDISIHLHRNCPNEMTKVRRLFSIWEYPITKKSNICLLEKQGKKWVSYLIVNMNVVGGR